MTITELVARFKNVKPAGQGFQARCPVHEDAKQSLSINPGDKGIVLHCHAGCDSRDILKSIGLGLKDLFAEPLPPRANGGNGKTARHNSAPGARVEKGPKVTDQGPAKATEKPVAKGLGKIVATYDYLDEVNKPLFQVVRFEPKDFRQRTLKDPTNPKAGWLWNTRDVRKVIFRLPAVAAALKANPDQPLFIVEGEKDVLALEKAGALATCNAGGAGKWTLDLAQPLAPAKRVIVVADKDPKDANGKDGPGLNHARTVAASLASGSRSVKIITVPDIPDKVTKDAADFLAAGGTVDQLLKVADSTPALQGTAKADLLGELPPCIFDLGRQRWFLPSPSGNEWLPVNDTRVAVYLKSRGFSEFVKNEFMVSVLESAMQKIVMEKNVHFAGQVSGFKAGVKEICGKRVLITTGPRLIEPKPGEFPTLLQMLEEMLIEEKTGNVQWMLFCGWLKAAYESLRDGTMRPGLVLVLCGKAGSGKSLLQTLITLLLGGRSANPYSFMTGKTDFNLDLIGAEHMTIDDESSERDIKSRNNFGQHCKKMAVGHTVTLHGKGRDAINVERYCRITICINDDPHDLMVLPPMEDSIKEKFCMLRISAARFPTMEHPDDFTKFKAKLHAELPHFLHYLVTKFEAPVNLRHPRYGVTFWQHPDLLLDLEDLHPWRRLMELIDFVKPWSKETCQADGEVWSGTVQDLEEILKKEAPGRSGILRGPQGTGMDLGSAKQRLADRIGTRKSMGRTIWMIRKPTREPAPAPDREDREGKELGL